MLITKLDSNWFFELLEPGNLDAAIPAVEARAERGLATPEGAQLVRETTIPAVLKGKFKASVPGDVHRDLMANGVIQDSHLGLNEFRTQWIGRSKWRYSCEFEVSHLADFNQLVFHGIDTVAKVFLNRHELFFANDMHLRYEVDVTGALKLGANVLEVEFESQEDWAEQKQNLRGKLPNAYSDPTNQIRKMACNYGWDWGPTLVTVGLWKDVELHQFSNKFSEVRALPGFEDETACLSIDLSVVGIEQELLAIVILDGKEISRETFIRSIKRDLRVAGLQAWWPRGYGNQKLYDLQIKLCSLSGDELDSRQMKVGFRKVEIHSAPDEIGTSFEIRVNDTRIWVRGANWIPAHTSITEVTRELYEARIADAVAANMNLLRVWGGGIFESKVFYETCDREGILVWQDCLFACAAYPEDEETKALVSQEIYQASERLSHHPSLAVWNGSNENIWGYFDWGWQEALAGRAWGEGLYLDVIPGVLRKVDPTRPYQPSSPYSQTMDIHPNDPNHGSAHLWEPWNRQDYTNYLTSVPRFATEYGYQSPASYSTIVRAIGEDELWEDSPGMRAHQKAMDGKLKLRRAVDIRFHEPKDFDEWHFLTQLEQARALTTAVSHLRAHHDVCSGSVIWQLNDCWPVSSWAVVDSEGQRKPAWHAVRKSYQDVFVAFTGDFHDCAIVIVNDSMQDLDVDQMLYAWNFAGTKSGLRRINGKVRSGSFLRFELAGDLKAFSPKDNYLSFDVMDQTYTKFFEVDKDLNYLAPSFSVNIRKEQQRVQIEIKAETLLRDLCLFPDRIDSRASISDNFFTVVPGTSKQVTVETKHPELFSLEAVEQIIRTANDQAK